MLRLTRRCNCACEHCTLLDLPALPDLEARDALRELVEARGRGCDELVVMRGEPTLRRELPALAAAARKLGYRHVQLQTNGRMLCYAPYLDGLLAAGVNFFEVSLFGPSAAVHDAIAREDGAFAQTRDGLANLVARGAAHLVTIPVLARNLEHLEETVALVADLGLSAVQLNFTRPVRLMGVVRVEGLATLTEAGPKIRAAMGRARARGLATSSEAVPLCHLDPADRPGAERPEFFVDVRVVDLHRRHASFAAHQRENRPRAPACSACDLVDRCPVTWAAYQEVHGHGELTPIRERRADAGSSAP